MRLSLIYPTVFSAFLLWTFFNRFFLSCLCTTTEDFCVYYVFSFMLRLEIDQAVQGSWLWSRPHTSGYKRGSHCSDPSQPLSNSALCFIHGYGWEVQSFELKVVVWWYQRNAGWRQFLPSWCWWILSFLCIFTVFTCSMVPLHIFDGLNLHKTIMGVPTWGSTHGTTRTLQGNV